MEPMYAICGLDCSQCDAYLATQAGDESAKEAVAARWRVEYGNPSVDAAYVTCDGCLSSGIHGGHYLSCDVRRCGIGKGVSTCAYCPEYVGCGTIAEFLTFAPSLGRPLIA